MTIFKNVVSIPSFGRKLRNLRINNGWSLRELGSILGVTAVFICDLEHGKRLVSPKRAASIACILGEDISEFVRLSLQDHIDKDGLLLKVYIRSTNE